MVIEAPRFNTHSFPQTLIADRDGFKMLVDLNDIIPDWGYLGYYARADFLRTRRDTVTRYLRAHTRGLRDVRATPSLGVDVLRKHLKYEPAVAEAGYKEFVKSFAEDGRLPLKGFEFLLAEEAKARKDGGGSDDRADLVQALLEKTRKHASLKKNAKPKANSKIKRDSGLTAEA